MKFKIKLLISILLLLTANQTNLLRRGTSSRSQKVQTKHNLIQIIEELLIEYPSNPNIRLRSTVDYKDLRNDMLALVNDLNKYNTLDGIERSQYNNEITSKGLDVRNYKLKLEEQNKLMKFHGGNLLEHCQWATLRVYDWFTQGIDSENIKLWLLEYINVNIALIAAFFHDIGKAGDCIYDLYDLHKYASKGDSVHPLYSRKYIMGQYKYELCDGTATVSFFDIKSLVERLIEAAGIPSNGGFYVKAVALTAALHWDFGQINIGKDEEVPQRIDVYINRFVDECKQLQLTPSEWLLRLAMVVACADLKGASNIGIQYKEEGKSVVLEHKYFSFNPWVKFGMFRKYEEYFKQVIERFGEMEKINNYQF
jgi:hypothetical protein